MLSEFYPRGCNTIYGVTWNSGPAGVVFLGYTKVLLHRTKAKLFCKQTTLSKKL